MNKKATEFITNLGKAIAALKEKQRNCKHHPFDREIDDYENQICGLCKKVMKSADELYPDYE